MRDGEGRPAPDVVAAHVLDSITEGVVVLDHDWVYRYVNPAGAAYLGTTVDALLGQDYRVLYPEAEGTPFQQCYARVLESGQPETCIDHFEPWDRYFRNEVLPWADGIVIFFSDITAERREHDRIVRELEVFQQVMDHAEAEIALKDLAGRYVLVNQAGALHVGMPVHEMIGRTASQVLPADAAAVVRSIELEVQQTLRPVQRRLVFELRPGRPRTFLTVWFPAFDAEGQLAGTGAILTDITANERIEHALAAAQQESAESMAVLETLTRSAPVGIAFVDRELRFVRANDAMAEISGLPAAEHLGRSVAEVTPDIWPDIEAAYRKVLDEAEPVRDLEIHRGTTTRPGERRTWVVSLYPVQVGQGAAVSGVGVVAHDVTDQQRLEAQLRQSQKMEAVGQLAGGLAHDFNNLLATISLTAELARRESPPGEVDAALRRVLAATESATALTSQLLVFSRQQDVVPQTVDVNARVEEISEILDRTLGDDVRLRLDLGRVPAVVFDPTQLDQILLNLALNSRDAMSQGGLLSISTTVTDDPVADEGQVVELRVEDTGSGMSEETREHAFEPFFTTKEEGKGTGLGLAMVYGAVQAAGGRTAIYSEPGSGTSVSVLLPPARDLPATTPAPRTEEAPRGNGERVVVVEDRPDLRDMVVAVLSSAGYDVVGHGPDTALAAIESAAPDLLVTDVVMPGLSGPELAAETTRRFPGTKVLLVSGYTEVMLRHKDLGPDGYRLLVKPFSARALLAAVSEVLAAPAPASPGWSSG